MCLQLHLAKINPDNYLMELVWSDGKPVGVAIARHQDRPDQPCKRLVVQAYVKAKHRRQGIGSALIRSMVDDREKVSGLGVKGSDLFWKSLDVAPDDMLPGTPKEKWQYF
jgi:GNAT superfamily N-acetyltransferase